MHDKMPLQAGRRFGPYEILSLIGTGGMGEVYQARDTRLDRRVALKVLAPELAADADFRARFAHEARAISSLNHPHICGLFDIGREGDTDYLVLELLEGETLAGRLARGPLPHADVLRFGIEIAGALETAHRQGIVHRDLKPANVMVTAAGTKLLDFGLAKHAAGAARHALSMLATAPGTGTAEGTIIGTLQYMAPEQVQGLPADARSDVFALGMLLYEMATGRRTFEATTQASLIAKILTSDVPAVSTLAPVTPPVFDHVVQGCLAKEPGDRWQTAHDVKLQLQWIQAQGSRSGAAAPATTGGHRAIWPWSAGAVIAGAALAATLLALWWPRVPVPRVPARFDVALPPEILADGSFDRGEISPDGRRFVFSASVNGRAQLFMRDIASATVTPIEDTESALYPFWSPDGRAIAFFALGKLKRIGVAGGPARVLCDASGWARSRTGGGTWGQGTILFPVENGSILRVPDTGGTATPLDTVPSRPGENAFVAPRFLPDGRHFLVSKRGDANVYAASLDSSGLQQILEDGSRAIYAAGHLLFFRGANVFARPFDAARLTFTGPETEVARRVQFVTAADNGTIVYEPQVAALVRLTWFDRRGRRIGALGELGDYSQVVLSRRETRATLVRPNASGDSDLWDVELTSGILSRLTTDPTVETDPSWSPDDRRLAFTSRRAGAPGVVIKDLSSGVESPLGTVKEPASLDEWTPDGQFIIFRNAGRAVWAVRPGGESPPRMLVDTPYSEDEVHVSPDGRWVAYNADESGRWEVYVARFPEFTGKRQISSGGGVQPQWSGDGRELFYLGLDGSIMAVQVMPGPDFGSGPPAPLFATRFQPTPHRPMYAVTRDAQRFLGLEGPEGERSTLTFLLNWLDPSSR